MNVKTTDAATIRIYLPVAAGDTPATAAAHDTVHDVVVSRACRHYGGATVYRDASGAWVDNHTTITEDVRVIEVIADSGAEVNPETFVRVNGKYIKEATDETLVIGTIDSVKYSIS